jgi:alkylation response protein AidB-like acyl-CoA dehydrogenase
MTLANDSATLVNAARRVVNENDPRTTPVSQVLTAWYDAGLTWVHFPTGLGGRSASRGVQPEVDRVLREAGGPADIRSLNGIGFGMAAPTLVGHARDHELTARWLRPLASADEIWCQLFSEPGAGSDLAGLSTIATRQGDEWSVTGQKVWTSLGHKARWGLLLARTDPDAAKHRGLTYFVVDMRSPGVEVRPLRQMTGQAEFNEVHLTGAVVPDAHRLGEVGDGWRVAMTTLMNERTAIGKAASQRGSGKIADAVGLWAARPDRQTPVLRDRLTALWLRAEAQRLTSERSRITATSAGPGPEGAIAKLVGAELNQAIYEFCMDLLGEDALLYHDYSMRDTLAPGADRLGPVQQRYLRSRANTIEGGTSEVLRNILGERILQLPGDLRADSGMPWKEIPRG